MGTGVMSGFMVAGGLSAQAMAADTAPPRRQRTARIGVLFTGQPQPIDRNWGADSEQIGAIKKQLTAVEEKLGNVDLMIGESRSPAETRSFVEQAGVHTPILAINVQNFAMTRVVQPILDAGNPMLVFALPASGHDWMYVPRWQRAGHRTTLLPSSDLGELDRAIRLLRVIPLMRQSNILLFPPARGTQAACSADAVKERLGATIVAMDQKELDEWLASADKSAVQAEVDAWTKGAKEIVEPNSDDIEKAARVSVVLDRLVEQTQADALAIGTCMGWLDRGFPCLGFARLRDRGVPAACEGDMDSVLTMLLMQYAFDLPGFQGNATFDTSRNALWTAHCTAPLKMDGPDSDDAPYLLRGHSEVAGSGCVPEVQYRLGQVITRAKLVNLDTILASTGEIIDVPERAVHGCRTQIVTRVRDAATMAANWSSVLDTEDAMTLLHRVVCYGDHLDSLGHLANLMGMKVVAEV